jgi:hypothetical protein
MPVRHAVCVIHCASRGSTKQACHRLKFQLVLKAEAWRPGARFAVIWCVSTAPHSQLLGLAVMLKGQDAHVQQLHGRLLRNGRS